MESSKAGEKQEASKESLSKASGVLSQLKRESGQPPYCGTLCSHEQSPQHNLTGYGNMVETLWNDREVAPTQCFRQPAKPLDPPSLKSLECLGMLLRSPLLP